MQINTTKQRLNSLSFALQKCNKINLSSLGSPSRSLHSHRLLFGEYKTVHRSVRLKCFLFIMFCSIFTITFHIIPPCQIKVFFYQSHLLSICMALTMHFSPFLSVRLSVLPSHMMTICLTVTLKCYITIPSVRLSVFPIYIYSNYQVLRLSKFPI